MEKLYTLEYNPETDGFHYNDGGMHADKDKSGWVVIARELTLDQCNKTLFALRKRVHNAVSKPLHDLKTNVMLSYIQDHTTKNNHKMKWYYYRNNSAEKWNVPLNRLA